MLGRGSHADSGVGPDDAQRTHSAVATTDGVDVLSVALAKG